MDKDTRGLSTTRKPPRSLRRVALIVTGIGAGTALAIILLQLIVNHVHYSGVLIIPGLIFIIGCMAVVGGLVTLMVDVVLRLSGRRL